jgi:sigma-B regulation protein RsbU (phosphoserine phosphatase)
MNLEYKSLKSLIDLVDDIIVVVDRYYNIQFINKCARAIIYDSEFVLNSKCYTTLFNKIVPCENCQLSELIVGRPVKVILHDTFSSKGIRKLYSATFERLNENLYAEILSDITDERRLTSGLTYKTKQLKAHNVILRRNMSEIKEKTGFLNKILNSLPIGIMVVNEDLKILEINELMKDSFVNGRNVKIGDSCFSIYGYNNQCEDCQFKNKHLQRTARHEGDKHFTIFFHELDRLLAESSMETTRIVSLVNEIKQKQTELNERQHQMTLLNTDLMKANKKLKEFQKIIEEELHQVREIQNSMLPLSLPKLDGYQFAATYIPTEDVGGDYYDYIKMSNNYYGFLVADVSGHGIPAAVIMAITRAVLHSYSVDIVSSSEVLTMINEILCYNIYTNDYVTMFYFILNTETGVGNYASAGHHPILFFDKSKMVVEKLKAKGMFLGIFKDVLYEEKDLLFEEGDVLFLYTDGLVDIQNTSNEFYGLDRLMSKLIMLNEESPEEIVDDILNDIEEFSGGRAYVDDLTMLIVKKGGSDDKG